MAEKIDVVDGHVITYVGADHRAIINANGQAKVVEFKEIGLKFSYADEAEKLASLDEVGIEWIRYEYPWSSHPRYSGWPLVL